MMLVLEILVWILVGLVLLPMLVLVGESLAALLPRRRTIEDPSTPRARCAILMPAHNEEAVIDRTVAAVLPQLLTGDRLVVVADNCTDRTAAMARTAGATVIERTDAERRGKGFALDHGVRHLEKDPPEVVVIVDADCRVEAGSLDRLVRQATRTGRPAQAAYVLDDPPNAGPRQQLSAFAFLYKNVVRPSGLDRLGLPCLLTGTGMAFPWPTLRDAELASSNIVEDMKLGVDLAVAGQPAKLCPEANVRGELPSGSSAAVSQRTRWEHGHLQTLLTQAPRLVGAGLRRAHPGLLGLALELSVPPLSMLFLLWAGALVVAVGWWIVAESPLPALVLLAGAGAVGLAIFCAWVKYGRERLPFTSLLTVPFYILGKVPIYLTFVFKRQKAWVRTPRNASAPTDGSP